MSNILFRPLCWARTRMSWPYPISGHTFVETEDITHIKTPVTAIYLVCGVCGKESRGWYEQV